MVAGFRQTVGLAYDPQGTYSSMTEPTTLRLILSILLLPTSRIQGPSRVRAIRDKWLIQSTPKRRSMVYNLQGIHERTCPSNQGSRQREVRIHHACVSRRYIRRPGHRKRDLARGRREVSNHSHRHGRHAQKLLSTISSASGS